MSTLVFDPKNQKSINQKFRLKRFEFFLKFFNDVFKKEDRVIRILDIGGTEVYWERMDFPNQNLRVEITLLNLWEVPVKNKGVFKSIKGDATNLSQYQNGEFDLIYSNSCIEHLFTWEKQKLMAAEIRRVGKRYFVQTPNYWFPIEPHWNLPFFQYFPISVRVFITYKIGFGNVGKQKDKNIALNRVKEVRLLTLHEMKNLFPEGKVYKERFLGLVKSFTLYS